MSAASKSSATTHTPANASKPNLAPRPPIAPVPPRREPPQELLNSPFPTAEDDAADDEAARAEVAARLEQLLHRPSAPRDTSLLRTLAWERHCQGVSVRDIADEFTIPERTIRSWLATQRDELSSDLAELRQTHLLLAVDSLRRLLATTWELLEVERDATLRQLEAISAAPESHPAANRPRHSHAPRYINSVLAIQKELNRILALSVTTLPSADTTQNPAEMATPTPQPEIPAETAVLATPQTQTSAETATTPPTETPTPPISVPPRPAGRGVGGEEPHPSPTTIPSPHAPFPRRG